MKRQAVQSQTAGRPRNVRRLMMAKIHAEFPNVRPDLRHSNEELRIARLEFCADALGLTSPPSSMTRLTEKQLGRVIEAIKQQLPAPVPAGWNVHHLRSRRADQHPTAANEQPVSKVIHLAGREQTWAIERVFDHLEWSSEKRAKYIQKRFGRSSARMLSPSDANSLLMILFTVAASRHLKEQGVETVKREMVADYIPTLKRKLGIGVGQRGTVTADASVEAVETVENIEAIETAEPLGA